jgi:hypothetical protein
MEIIGRNLLSFANYLPVGYPNVSSTMKKVAIVVGIATGVRLFGYELYQYIKTQAEEYVRKEIADLIVLGCTRDSKLDAEELQKKALAIRIRKECVSILSSIANKTEIDGVPLEDLRKFQILTGSIKMGFQVVDQFSTYKDANLPSLPMGWDYVYKPTIEKKIIRSIQLNSKRDPTPEEVQEKMRSQEEKTKTVNAIFSAIEKANEGNPIVLRVIRWLWSVMV